MESFHGTICSSARYCRDLELIFLLVLYKILYHAGYLSANSMSPRNFLWRFIFASNFWMSRYTKPWDSFQKKIILYYHLTRKSQPFIFLNKDIHVFLISAFLICIVQKALKGFIVTSPSSNNYQIVKSISVSVINVRCTLLI